MTHNHAGLDFSFDIQHEIQAFLSHHFPNRIHSNLWIVGGIRELPGQFLIHIFEIREIDIDQGFQGNQTRYPVVTIGVIHESRCTSLFP